METPHHWRDVAIAKSEIISDAWEVTKAYSARLAEWVLFICMIFNIVEILPDVHLPGAVSSAVLATQAVTLDIAGFGLASMAEHARRMGNEAAAKRAAITGYSLITIMLVTLCVVTVGILWPETKSVIVVIEKLLILARVLMTVIYGHVIHGLRTVSLSTVPVEHHTDEQRSAQPVDSSNSEQRADTSVDTDESPKEDKKVDTLEDTEEDCFVDTDEHTIVNIQEYTKGSPKQSTKQSTTSGRGTAQQKALRILKRNPGIGPAELAKRAQISRSYANRILSLFCQVGRGPGRAYHTHPRKWPLERLDRP